MELTSAQKTACRSWPIVNHSSEYPFLEDLAPNHTRVESNVPFMSFLSCMWPVTEWGQLYATESFLGPFLCNIRQAGNRLCFELELLGNSGQLLSSHLCCFTESLSSVFLCAGRSRGWILVVCMFLCFRRDSGARTAYIKSCVKYNCGLRFIQLAMWVRNLSWNACKFSFWESQCEMLNSIRCPELWNV